MIPSKHTHTHTHTRWRPWPLLFPPSWGRVLGCVKAKVGVVTLSAKDPVAFAGFHANERTTRVKSYVHASHPLSWLVRIDHVLERAEALWLVDHLRVPSKVVSSFPYLSNWGNPAFFWNSFCLRWCSGNGIFFFPFLFFSFSFSFFSSFFIAFLWATYLSNLGVSGNSSSLPFSVNELLFVFFDSNHTATHIQFSACLYTPCRIFGVANCRQGCWLVLPSSNKH